MSIRKDILSNINTQTFNSFVFADDIPVGNRKSDFSYYSILSMKTAKKSSPARNVRVMLISKDFLLNIYTHVCNSLLFADICVISVSISYPCKMLERILLARNVRIM